MLNSCDEDSVADNVDPYEYPLLTISPIDPDINNTTINEGDDITASFKVELSAMLRNSVAVSARQIGGTADEDDYAFSSAVIAPWTNEAIFTISINPDGITEETETLELEIGVFDVANMYTVSPASENYIFNLTIENCATCVTCDWTLDMQDDYGDGWNGGYLTFIANGNALGDFAASGSGTSETISIPNDVLLEVFYTSGSWESENTYQIYDPNGTLVHQDGPTPNTGLVYSTTNICP
jgi:hypothetical protein